MRDLWTRQSSNFSTAQSHLFSFESASDESFSEVAENENADPNNFVRADINDSSIVRDQMADADIVVHF